MRYYICSENTAKALITWTTSFHYIVIAPNQVIVKAKFSEASHEALFSGQPGVTACPHPLSGQTFGQAGVPNAVTDLLKQYGISHSDTMHSASEKLKVIVPHMALSVF
jgi:hypothetical protein